MTVLASEVISRCRVQLIDTGATYRWSDAELLDWLSDGQRAVVAAVPQASAVIAAADTVAGSKQAIPADGHALLTVHRNVGGRACVPVARELLDTQYPNWHAEAPVAAPKFFVIDEVDPKTYWLYPPHNGVGQMEIAYARYPVEIEALSSPLTVDDVYQTPLVDYVLYRAHLKDSDFGDGPAAATAYFTAFTAFLTAQKGP